MSAKKPPIRKVQPSAKTGTRTRARVRAAILKVMREQARKARK